jgi:uncharacterized protein YecT (DUF1311 family)
MTVRATTTIAGLLICVLPLCAGAACSRNAHGVFEDPACASEAFSKADKELNQVYQQLLAQLDEEAQKKLRVSQRAWLAYRNANSSLVYAVEGDGSAGRIVAWNQSEQAIVARIKELRSWLRR